VVIHLFGAVYVVPRLIAPNPPSLKTTKVRLVTVDGNVVRPYRSKQPLAMASAAERERRRAAAERKKDEEAKKELEQATGQVVDLPPSPDDRAPENARFLSEHNTRTEHESVSRHRQKDYGNAMNELTVTDKSPADVPPNLGSGDKVAVTAPTTPRPGEPNQQPGLALEIPNIQKRQGVALAFDPASGKFKNQGSTETLLGNSDRLQLSLGDPNGQNPDSESNDPRTSPSTVNLIPPVGVLARIAGAPSNDYVEGVDEGEGTFLNSREFKFASYFNRMKRGVSQNWDPLSEYRRRDPTGNIYGIRARVTVVNVTLNRDGELKHVEVVQSSGIDFLDREAVAAFQRATPFPNPPKALVGTDGTVTFPFGFHIDFTGNGGWGMNR